MSSAAMASSSVSQEDVENDFEKFSRRTRIRLARARDVRSQPLSTAAAAAIGARIAETEDAIGDLRCSDPVVSDPAVMSVVVGSPTSVTAPLASCSTGGSGVVLVSGSGVPGSSAMFAADYDVSPKPTVRPKDKRLPSRPTHLNKCKPPPRDRRKLREKRRSSGVVHMPSTESTGGSTNDDENRPVEGTTVPVTSLDQQRGRRCSPIRNKSVSDLDADDEDNQDCDSVDRSDSTINLAAPTSNLTTASAAGGAGSCQQLDQMQLLCNERDQLVKRVHERDQRIVQLEKQLQLQQQQRQQLQLENDSLTRALQQMSASK